jgi:GNAT superfamily N-acetyltransferase
MNTDKHKIKVEIRHATLPDVPQLCGLLGLLFAQEADFKPDTERQTRGLSMIIENPEIGRIYCAKQEASILGMVSLLYTVSTAEGGRAAWMEDMVVHPDWRGHRIGEQLLQWAVGKAREAGCHRITLLTDADNVAAIRFYSRAGFTRSSMVPLRLKL